MKKQKIKQSKGITLISLVITIIVLLILAGVSIAMLTGENGILTQAIDSKRQTKSGEMEEDVKFAISELKSMDYTQEITLEKIYNILNEDGKLNGKLWNELSNTEAEYIDEKDEVIILIKLENEEITIEKELPEDLANREILQINIEKIYDDTTKQTNINIFAKSNKDIQKLILINSDGTEEELDSNIQANEVVEITRIVNKDGIYRARIVGNEKTIEKSVVVTTHTLAPEIQITPENPTSGNVQVTINYDEHTTLTKQYSLDGVTWNTVNENVKIVEFKENGVIYAAYTENGIQKQVETANITNIDRILPTVTLNYSTLKETSFRLNAAGSDEQGILKYEFYVDDVLIRTNTTTATSSYVDITGKDDDTSYTCYVKIYDKAGNVTKSTDLIVTTPKLKLSSQVDLGDYLYYSAPSGSVTKWRVFSENSDGTIEIIPTASLKNYTISGIDGYKKAVKLLNDQAQYYINRTYATSARALGSNKTNPRGNDTITKPNSWDDHQAKVTVDSNYSADASRLNAIDQHDFGVQYLWLASRNTERKSYEVKYGLRAYACYHEAVYTNYGISLGNWKPSGTKNSYSPSAGFVAVVTLKSEVSISSGLGTLSSPYRITIE